MPQNKAKCFGVIRQKHILLLLRWLLRPIPFSIILLHLSLDLRASRVIPANTVAVGHLNEHGNLPFFPLQLSAVFQWCGNSCPLPDTRFGGWLGFSIQTDFKNNIFAFHTRVELLFMPTGVLCTLENQMCATNNSDISVFPQLTLPHHLLRFFETLSHHSPTLWSMAYVAIPHLFDLSISWIPFCLVSQGQTLPSFLTYWV